METPSDGTIFSKINFPYDDLRALKNPFRPIKDYYRKTKLSQGDDLWWIENDNEETGVIRQWSNLSQSEKQSIRVEAFCMFPELFSNSSLKYQQLASWLVARYKIVSPSLRDTFTAGGQVTLNVKNKTYQSIPRIFEHLVQLLPKIKNRINNIDNDELVFYWKYNKSISSNNRYKIWCNLICEYSASILKNTKLNIMDIVL